MTPEAAGPGRPAPGFDLPDQHGRRVKLSDLLDGGSAVLVFYPFAFTGVCTGELAALEKRLPDFAEAGARVVALSCDSRFALRVFGDREGLSLPLLSDFWPHGEVARAYGVLDEERGAALRGTFVVDAGGVVRWRVVNAMPDARDVEEYLAAVARLGG